MGRLFDRCCRYDLIITDARLGTQGWPGGLARDQSSRSWLASSLPAFFEALRLLLSRCHARRAAVAQTSPACAYCRRRPRGPHPRHLQESHQFGQESRAALLLSLGGTEVSVAGKRNFQGRDKEAETAFEIKAPVQRQNSRRTPPIRGYSPGSGKSPLERECVVADAVAVEPVSARKFPANREKNRLSRNFGRRRRISPLNCPLNPAICSEIPYAAEHGKSFKTTGKEFY